VQARLLLARGETDEAAAGPPPAAGTPSATCATHGNASTW